VTETNNEMMSVIIGGKEYVPKSALEELKNNGGGRVVCNDRFTIKQESAMHIALQSAGYGFHDVPDCISEAEAAEDDIAVMDAANVCMVCGKTLRAKLFLRRYVSIEQKKGKMPNLDYIKNDYEGQDIKSKYALTSILGAMNFFKKSPGNQGAASFKMKRDYPITIEDDDFRFIIAPRVESE
jgi:hypothetical protein